LQSNAGFVKRLFDKQVFKNQQKCGRVRPKPAVFWLGRLRQNINLPATQLEPIGGGPLLGARGQNASIGFQW
jgi:hypothetical protein